MTTAQFAILADDLTGACDAAAPFARRGRRCWIAWKAENLDVASADVISACSTSRSENESAAIDRTRHMARALGCLAPRRFFKKIDSTLRGHWVAEIGEMMTVLGRRAAVIAPAYPAMGRQIVDGQLRTVDRNVDLIDQLAKQNSPILARIDLVSIKQLRAGSAVLRNWITERMNRAQLFVVDAATDADLEVVADTADSLADVVLPVGSAGLAAAIASGSSREPHVTDQPLARVSAPPADGTRPPRHTITPVVTFVGSTNVRSIDQLNALTESTMAHEIELEESAGSKIVESLQCRIPVIVRMQWTPSSASILNRLLDVCRQESADIVLTGGDTAQFVCNCAAVDGIWIEGEVSTGIPYGKLSGGTMDGARVVTKAGGFGDRRMLMTILEFLRDRRSENDACPAAPTQTSE